MFSGLLVLLFVKLLYYTTYFFNSKLAPIFAQLFFVFYLASSFKIETLSNSVNVRLIPYLVEWMVS